MTEIGIDVKMMNVDAQVAQEQEDDQHDQHAADQRVLLHRRGSTRLMKIELSSSTVSLSRSSLAVDALDFLAHAVGDLRRCSCPTAW